MRRRGDDCRIAGVSVSVAALVMPLSVLLSKCGGAGMHCRLEVAEAATH